MELFIGYHSALEFWRLRRAARIACANVTNKQDSRESDALKEWRGKTLPIDPPDLLLLDQNDNWKLTTPIDIILGNPSARRQNNTVKQHVYRGDLPPGSFVKSNDGLIVSSPEFCFLQMATKLPLVKLIELGYELCGTYTMPANATAKKQKDQQEANKSNDKKLTTKKRLDAFTVRMAGMRGHKNAVRALRYITEGSASPMETKLAMLLTLPYMLGGYGFPLPEMNTHIIPLKSAKHTASKSYYACDLFWPDYELAVEYDSDLHHTGSKRIASDAKKRNTLTTFGLMVITVTKQQVFNIAELEKVARLIAINMEKRLQFKNPRFTDAQLELRRLLLWWDRV